MAAHDLHRQGEADGVAQLVNAIKVEVKRPFPPLLTDGTEPSAGESLAQQHAEHRRLGRVFQHLGGEVKARGVGTCRQIQFFRTALPPQGDDQFFPSGLMDLVNAGIRQGVRQFLPKAGQKCTV